MGEHCPFQCAGQLLFVSPAVCTLVLEFLEAFQCLGDPIPMQLELGFYIVGAKEMEPFMRPVGYLPVERRPRRNKFAARGHTSYFSPSDTNNTIHSLNIVGTPLETLQIVLRCSLILEENCFLCFLLCF